MLFIDIFSEAKQTFGIHFALFFTYFVSSLLHVSLVYLFYNSF